MNPCPISQRTPTFVSDDILHSFLTTLQLQICVIPFKHWKTTYCHPKNSVDPSCVVFAFQGHECSVSSSASIFHYTKLYLYKTQQSSTIYQPASGNHLCPHQSSIGYSYKKTCPHASLSVPCKIHDATFVRSWRCISRPGSKAAPWHHIRHRNSRCPRLGAAC